MFNPEHARLVDKHGWSKDDIRQANVSHGWPTYPDPYGCGEEAITHGTGWRVPADHADAIPQEPLTDLDTRVQLMWFLGPDRGSWRPNAGASSIVETFGAWERLPAVAKVEE